jgi:hypothetical protein
MLGEGTPASYSPPRTWAKRMLQNVIDWLRMNK